MDSRCQPHEAFHSLFETGERHPLTRYVAEIFGGEYNIKTSDCRPPPARSSKIFDEFRDEAVRRGELPRAVVAAIERRTPEPEPTDDNEPGTGVRSALASTPFPRRNRRSGCAMLRSGCSRTAR